MANGGRKCPIFGISGRNIAPLLVLGGRNSAPSLVSLGGIGPCCRYQLEESLASVRRTVPHCLGQ